MLLLMLWTCETGDLKRMTNHTFGTTRFVATLLAIIMAVGALPMMTSEDTIVDSASAQTENLVKVGWVGDFMNWNPLKADFVSDWVAYNLIFSTLFQYDEDWDKIENHLAMDYYQVEWPSGNMSTYINITENAYFRNVENPEDTSHPLTAEDIKFTFDLIQANPGNTWDYYLYNVSATYVLNDHQVQIDTDYPKATLIDDLVWVPILPKFQWQELTGGAVLGHFNPEDLTGSGPFYYADGARNDWHNFFKAPNFHGTTDYGDDRDIDYDGIQFQIFTDTVGLVFAINSGEVDVVDVTGAQKSAWDDIGTTPEPVIKQVTEELGVYDIAINAIPLEIREEIGYADSGNKILLDRTVRQAIGMTLNKPGIVDEFWGLAEEADTVLNPGYWHADLSNPLPFDPAAAKQLLIDAGYEDTNGNGYLQVTTDSLAYQENWAEEGDELNFRLHVPDTDPGYSTIGMKWVSWARDAGIYFDFEAFPTGPMTNEEWYKCEYDLWVWSWYWGPEPLSNLACWLSAQIRQGGYNCVGPICQGGLNEPDGWWWVNQDEAELRCGFDDTFDLALRATNKSERKILVDELQEAIYETYTEFPPIHPLGLYAMSTARFDGWGNWEESVARTIISDMLWIWYDLYPTTEDNAFPVFETSPLSGYESLVNEPITFLISVSDEDGDEITINWSAGDGTNYTEKVSGDTTVATTREWTHTYDTIGTYNLRVGLTDPEHVYEVVKTAKVTVLSEPNLGPYLEGLTVSPFRAYAGDETTWSLWASDAEQGPDGEGLLITWDWGDGTYTTSLHQPVDSNVLVQDIQTHTWDSVGTYPVAVFVWDGFDTDDNPSHNITVAYPGGYQIHENSPPSVPAAGNISGLAGQLTACEAVSSDPDPDNLRFTWDWGDGTFNVTNHASSLDLGEEKASSVMHQWDAAGVYPVEIWVDDGQEDHNVSATIYAHIYDAGEEAPPGSITIMQAPNPGTVDVPVVLTVGASDPNEDALTVTIDFGDDSELEVAETAGGTTGMQHVEFSHVYSEQGTFAAMVFIDDGTNNISAVKNVVVSVNEPPIIALASSYSFYYNQSKTLRPVSIGDPDGDFVSVWYDWGDDNALSPGDPDDAFSASHAYNETGEFVLTAYADDGKGNNISTTADIDVLEANFRPTLVAVEKSAPAGEMYVPGETIFFNVTARDPEGDVMTLVVDFGDGTTPEEFTMDGDPAENVTLGFTYSYDKGSSTAYTVTISVMDDQDHSDMTPISQEIRITVEDTGDGISDALLLLIAAIAIILALIAAAILMKRKGGDKKPSDIDEMEGMAPSEATEEVQDSNLEPQLQDEEASSPPE